ncbi:MAG: hypothetical protein ACLRNQ_23825 [Flavonifractor plautii]
MKKQVLSLLLAGALTLGLFGCSAQTPEESGVPQSAPAQTEGTASAGVVEELKIGICKEVTPRTLASESGSFGRMNYNAFCAGTWLVRDENNEMQPQPDDLLGDSGQGQHHPGYLCHGSGNYVA